MSVELTIETVEEEIVLELQDHVPAVLTIDNIPELRDELDSRVDKVEGYSLVADDEIDKLSTVEQNATANRPDAQNADKIHEHVIADVAGLDDALADKVDAVAGMGLSELSFTTADKLSLDQSEQDRHTHSNKTVIDDLSDDSGVLQYKGLPISDQAALDAKVDKVAGKSLVSDTEIAKLLTVQENATKNRADSLNADKIHGHTISDVTGLTTRLNDIEALVSAGDAMAGDAAAQLQGLSTSLFDDPSAISFVNQSANNATGELNSNFNAYRLSTQYLVPFRDIESIEVAPGWLFMLTELDANESVVAYTTSWFTRKTSFHPDTRYIRLMLQNPGWAISPADLAPDVIKITTRLKSSYEEMRLRDRIGADYLKTAVVVNDWKNERIAHCSTIMEDLTDATGTMWAGYYATATDEVESITSDVHCVLLKLNTCDLHAVERFVALEKGQVVGDWKQDTHYSPYDPVLIVNETNIQYLMVGNNVNDSTGVKMCQRIFDKATETFADEIQTLKIKYSHLDTEYIEDMSMSALNTMTDRLMGRTGANLGYYPIFSGRIDKANGYYWVYLGSMQTLGTGFQGCILRSVDGIVWEYVSAPVLAYMNVWEGALKVIGQKVYVLIKADNRYRIYYYDLDTGTWFEGPQILYQILARPFLWHYMGKLYAIYNAPNNVTSWGSVNRSSVAISVVDQETLEIIDTQIIKTDAGCHYFSVCDYKGTPYFMYTEDRKKFNIAQMKGNISVTPMWFLNV